MFPPTAFAKAPARHVRLTSKFPPPPKVCQNGATTVLKPEMSAFCLGSVKDTDPHGRPVFIDLSWMSRMSTFLAGGGGGRGRRISDCGLVRCSAFDGLTAVALAKVVRCFGSSAGSPKFSMFVPKTRETNQRSERRREREMRRRPGPRGRTGSCPGRTTSGADYSASGQELRSWRGAVP
jgi:hypothetical protein